MQIVIEIPDKEFGVDINDKFQDFFSRLKAETKEHLITNTSLVCGTYELETIDMFLKAFKGGIPLPKGHGRLIDANELCEDRVSNDTVVIVAKCARTIIEADKAYEVEVVTRGKCIICGKELTEGLFFCKECGDKANGGK